MHVEDLLKVIDDHVRSGELRPDDRVRIIVPGRDQSMCLDFVEVDVDGDDRDVTVRLMLRASDG